MTTHTYPSSAMLGDYFRSAAGAVPCCAILATVRVGHVAVIVLGIIAALFLVFGISTLLRHRTRIEMTEKAVNAVGPLGASVVWDELERMKLLYYSTRRDRRDGWMQLELRSAGGRLSLDSRIEGFAALVERAARAAAARGLALNDATITNLQSLGINLPTVAPLIAEAVGGMN